MFLGRPLRAYQVRKDKKLSIFYPYLYPMNSIKLVYRNRTIEFWEAALIDPQKLINLR